MWKLNVIENEQEFSAIMLHCDKSAIKQLSVWHMIITNIKFQLRKLTHFLLHDTQVTDKASGPLLCLRKLKSIKIATIIPNAYFFMFLT
jgi:hypothetical protein